MSTHIYYNRIDGLYQVYCAIFFMKRKLTGACIKDFLRVRKAFFRVKNEKCLYHVRVEIENTTFYTGGVLFKWGQGTNF